MGRTADIAARLGAFAALALALAGCATSAGQPAPGFLTPEIARAYIPLAGPAYLVLEGRGAATVIAPGIAATNAHNANLVSAEDTLGVSRDYDLLFLRSAARAAPPHGKPYVGERVIAYGQGVDGGLRMARGRVRWTDAEVLPRCRGCPVQHAFAFRAEGGKGFSGGPVVDAKTGRLIGIVFGFRNGLDDRHPGRRLMYAYDMARVFDALSRLPHKDAPAAPHRGG